MNTKKHLSVQKHHDTKRPVTVWDAMNSFFDDNWHPFGSFFNDSIFSGKQKVRAQNMMHAVDFSENDKQIKVVMDIPGYDPKDINVDIDENVLCVSAETNDEKEEKEDRYYRKERYAGTFSKSIALPTYIDADKARCTAKNGSLTIVIPKKKEAGKKSIKVQVQ
ncbi:Hsp20 family protein [Candidatus Peregrinibacteria bacterium]|nr:Hsp20 family protein [Candidatus Peregrinibacteria bacterium]